MGRRLQGKLIPTKWYDLTPSQQAGFVMNGKVQYMDWYINGHDDLDETSFWSTTYIDKLIEKAKNRENNYYGETDTFLYECLDNYSIRDKRVAILGSVEPWYESIVLAYGGIPTTIEYNKLTTDDSRLNLLTVEEYNNNPISFDAAFSISSFEHDGLGRYGDPVDPEGDIKAMSNVKENIIKKSGLLFLSVPIGIDKCVWNAHRIYGNHRYPLLVKGFDVVYSSGFFNGAFNTNTGVGAFQPVAVLKPK